MVCVHNFNCNFGQFSSSQAKKRKTFWRLGLPLSSGVAEKENRTYYGEPVE
jgi:hypothetical protein